MALVDSYRNTVSRKRKEIVKLNKNKVKEQKKISDLNKKIQRASNTLSRTKSSGTMKSKMREIERSQKKITKIEDKIVNIEKKIAKKQNEILQEQKKIVREEEKEIKKKQKAEEIRNLERERNLSEISNTLDKHEKLHIETQNTLEKLQELPEKIVVLFLASNPIDQQELRLDQEARSISEMIRKAKHRDSVELKTCWAVRPMDVLQAINEHNPSVVHFSGHGSSNDEIVFQDNKGKTKLVSKDAIVQTMMASSENLRLVFFNTCYSKNQAESVVEHVEATIGMNTTIGDEAARVFASQFYSAIGFGLSIEKSFEQAKALLMLEGIEEENTPELFVHDGLDPDNLIIVKPQIEE